MKIQRYQRFPLVADDLAPVIVVDDFLKHPDIARHSALSSGFGTWRPNKGEIGSSNYDGLNFHGDHATLLRALTAVLAAPVFPGSMYFRVTNAGTEGAYVHSDRESGHFSAIVYLSRHDDSESGTGFYRHRETGLIRMPSLEEMRKGDPAAFEKLKRDMVDGPGAPWELLHFVPGTFNRALIFDAPRFHARLPRHGFGSTAEDGRMIWGCHFYL